MNNKSTKTQRYKTENIIKNSKKSVQPILLSAGIFIIGIVIAVLINTNIIINNMAVEVANTQPHQENTNDIEKIYCQKQEYTLLIGESVTPNILTVPSNDQNTDFEWSIDNKMVAVVDENGCITAIGAGKARLTIQANSKAVAQCDVIVNIPKEHIIQEVPLQCQNGVYPSGCESVSTCMLLNYLGFDITTDEFIDSYLPQSYLMADETGYIGPDTSSYYMGSPYSEDALGCFPPVIVYAVNKYLSENNYSDSACAIDTTGLTMDELCSKYIVNDTPVLVWSTMYLNEPYVSYEWTVTETAEYSNYKVGDTCRWLAWEHCLVLVGYDEDYYYFNDPLEYYQIAYYKEDFNLRFGQIGNGSVAVVKTNKE